jgi:hypothetical protein
MNGMSVDEKVRDIRATCDKTLVTTSSTVPVSGEKNLAPDIISYLKDTFDSVDTDGNGTLDTTEFWNILVSVLQLTEGDKQILSVCSISSLQIHRRSPFSSSLRSDGVG